MTILYIFLFLLLISIFSLILILIRSDKKLFLSDLFVKTWFFNGILFFSLMILIYLSVIYFVVDEGLFKDKLASMGTFGDSFGALNSLFSGLAFIGILITYNEQKKQFEYQKIKLEYQIKNQEDQFIKESIDSKLSILLDSHKKIRENLEYFSYISSSSTSGNSALKKAILDLLSGLLINPETFSTPSKTSVIKSVEKFNKIKDISFIDYRNSFLILFNYVSELDNFKEIPLFILSKTILTSEYLFLILISVNDSEIKKNIRNLDINILNFDLKYQSLITEIINMD